MMQQQSSGNNGHSQHVNVTCWREPLQLCAVEIEIVKPPKNGRLVVPCREDGFTTYKPKYLAKHNKVVTAKRILLDSVKDHLIPCIVRENTTKDMYDALETLFQSANISKKMLLKNKLTSSHTSKTLASNLIKKQR